MPSAARKVIITCAITGGIHVPSQTPHLPISPEQIADSAVGAAEAGAAILHLHARNPDTGEPTPDPEVWARFLPVIHERTDAVINMTTGGGLTMTVEDRMRAPLRFQPEMCSLNMGSINFGLFPIKDRISQYRYDWEEPYLEGTRDGIFRNTFTDIERFLRELGETHGTRFEFECYDVGHLYTLAHFLDRGLVRPPLLVQTIFGVLGGIGADLDNFRHMAMIAERLFGADHQLSCFAAGRHQMAFATAAALAGGHVRVGLEDSLYLERGRLAKSNAEQVEKVVRILRELGRDIATPDEARALLGLRGREETR